ncbi:MAG TPA: adenylate cyclase [Chloroflexi bacterium]|nr:adenylate cyclase [Chloroflexota bacterium]
MGTVIHLRLLGPVQVERAGTPVQAFESRKVLALLCYLAAHDQPVPRSHLADLFWPDKREAQGRANLSWALHKLTTLLPGSLQSDRHAIHFPRTPTVSLDLATFAGLVAQDHPAALTFAAELYRGDLISDIVLDNCPDFEIWLVQERERWRQRVAQVLHALVLHHSGQREYAQSLRFASRLLELEPWREEAHRQVMALLALSGQRGAALGQYESCRRILNEELGVEPEAETVALYEQIRQGAWEQGREVDKGYPFPSSPPLPCSPERRQITVLAADLVDLVALPQQSDPEEMSEAFRAFQQLCSDVIHRHGGHLAPDRRDRLLAYFGYPEARETDALQAVRAGLSLVAAVRDTLNLALGVGIDTGLVVTGENEIGESPGQELVGEPLYIATRLLKLAEPNSVVISGTTHALVQGYFVSQPLGTHTLRGVGKPVTVCRVLQESGARSRLEAVSHRGLTRLVGREAEVERLLTHWAQVQAGHGQVILLRGEAGIGKSRLLWTLAERLANTAHTWLECHGSPSFQNSAFYPVIGLLQQMFHLDRDPSATGRKERLKAGLAQFDLAGHAPEAVPLLGDLLSLPPEPDETPLNLTPERQKQKTMETALALLWAMARQQPVVLVVEDLHWVDPSSLDLLTMLVDRISTAPILALLTERPEFDPPWVAHPQVISVALGPLTAEQTMIMAEQVAGKTLPVEVLKQLVTWTDGVPLFVEELTKTVLESGALVEREVHYERPGSAPFETIPTTLRGSLMARLDRLGPVRQVAQLAAAIGREFPYELLRALSPFDEVTLQRDLSELVKAGLLYQAGEPPRAMYIFKHALIQEAAYRSMLKRKRRAYHGQIAQALIERFPTITETQPELLAQHYAAAGLSRQAIDYCQRAGQRATQRSAQVEAIADFNQALALLETLPQNLEHQRQELDLRMQLGATLMGVKGFEDPDVERTYSRARELCEQVGDSGKLYPVLQGLIAYNAIRGDLQTAFELGEQLLRIAQREEDLTSLLTAHLAIGTTLFWWGELAAARIHLEEGIALYDRLQEDSTARLPGPDPGVSLLGFVNWLLWLLGYPVQALARAQEALALAEKLSNPFSLAEALQWSAGAYQMLGEKQATRTQAEALIALAREQESAYWEVRGTILRGWALAMQSENAGGFEEGIMQIHRGLTALQASGVKLGQSYFLGLFAAAAAKGGQIEEGLRAVEEALALVAEIGERQWESELHRLKGELLLAASAENHAEAENCFRQALSVARQQGAKSLELRAAMGVSRLLRQQGRRSAARQVLVKAYGRFSEGFDTADLRAARRLLDELEGIGRSETSRVAG